MAAALLQSQGFEVIGITLNLFPKDSYTKRITIAKAKKVAKKLTIPHYIFDVSQEFERQVVNPFCQEYLCGRTPNPCVFCNWKIKFGILLSQARTIGVRYLATGHYARVMYDNTRSRFILKKGIDLKKDQSYFLFALSQDQLRSVIFPLGELTKSEVREKAKQIDLKVFERPESQDICFIPDNNYIKFLSNRFPDLTRTGPIVLTNGEILGEHKGIFFFTIGQRRGLNVARGYPLYVVSLDKATNTVVVGRKEETYRKELTVSRVNWIAIRSLDKPLELKVRIRYQHREYPARVIPLTGKRVKVEFFKPQMAITPGQVAVFYDGDTVVGGGWID